MQCTCTYNVCMYTYIVQCTVPVKKKLKYRTVTVPYLKSTTSEPRANHDRTTSEPLKCGSVQCGAVRFGPGALNHNLLTKSCPTSSHVDSRSIVSIDRSKEGTFSRSTQGGVFVILCLAGASFHIATISHVHET